MSPSDGLFRSKKSAGSLVPRPGGQGTRTIEFLCENSHILSTPPLGGGLTNMRLRFNFNATGGTSLVPPVVKSQICEPSAVRRRTPNLSPPSLREGGEFSHKNSMN